MTSPRRHTGSILALAVSAALLAACAPTSAAQPDPPPTATGTATPTPAASSTPTPTQPPPTALSPLRGTTVLASTITGPALSAKVDNHGDARPQWGLEHTDIVFEELVEGGITRYVAVWFSDVPAEIGPVRSIRPMDPDIISPLGGIVAYSGGQQRFVDMMLDTPVHNAIHGGADDEFMYRTSKKQAPHNVIVKAQELRAAYASIAAAAAAVRVRVVGDLRLRPPRTGPRVRSARRRVRARHDSIMDLGCRIRRRTCVLRTVVPTAMRPARSCGRRTSWRCSVGIDWSYGIIPRTIMVGSGSAWVSSGGSTMAGHVDQAEPGVAHRAHESIRGADPPGAGQHVGRARSAVASRSPSRREAAHPVSPARAARLALDRVECQNGLALTPVECQ